MTEAFHPSGASFSCATVAWSGFIGRFVVYGARSSAEVLSSNYQPQRTHHSLRSRHAAELGALAMREYMSYRRKLAALQKARREVLAKAPQPSEGVEYEVDFSSEMEREIAEHRIFRLVSDYEYERAFKYGVPVPSGEDFWEDSSAYPGTSHLNRAGLTLLRASIHEEQKRRLEHFSVWVAGLTGLVGAITGLAAVLHG